MCSWALRLSYLRELGEIGAGGTQSSEDCIDTVQGSKLTSCQGLPRRGCHADGEALPRAHMAASCFPEGTAMGTVPKCHGKSEALIFVLDCSSPIFTTGKLQPLCSHLLGREVWGGGGGSS